MAQIDRYATKILRELSLDGRLSNVELAERVGLSPSACLRRVQSLEQNGVIEGYRAVLNPQQMGIGFAAYITVGLSDHSKAAQHAFEQAMQTAPEVTECHNVTGAIEYLLRVEVADLPAYKSFHTNVLGVHPQVSQISTYVVMGSPKNEHR